MIEFLTLLFIVAFFFGLSLVQRWLRQRRDRTNMERAHSLRGHKVAEAREWLGEPTEIVFGSSGHRLYVWKLDEMEIVLTIDPADTVTETVAKVVC